jgi:hypothetical protein
MYVISPHDYAITDISVKSITISDADGYVKIVAPSQIIPVDITPT